MVVPGHDNGSVQPAKGFREALFATKSERKELSETYCTENLVSALPFAEGALRFSRGLFGRKYREKSSMNFLRQWLIRLAELAGASPVQSSTHIRLIQFFKLQLGRSAMRALLNRSLFILIFPLSLLLFAGSAHAISYNIFGDAAPPVPAWSDSNAVEVGVKFIANGSMQVQGVRFYKGSGNTGTHIAHLWNSVGALLATQKFSDENGSGWQTVLFTPPVPVNAGQIYTASYLAPQGHYAADVNGLADGRGLVTDPVYAPSNCAAGGNGV